MLSRYYQDCTALIFPTKEDLGLVTIEAQSFGKPVIAVGMGGAVETVIEGKTGIFFTPQTSRALIDVLKHFNESNYDPNDCIANAKKFSKERFKKEFTLAVNKIVSGS